jgi:hypothetical protein
MPEGYWRAKASYETILAQFPRGTENYSAAQRQQLLDIFQRKQRLNEDFWQAYQAGTHSNFTAFASGDKSLNFSAVVPAA